MTEERKLLILGLLRMNAMHGYMLNAHIDAISPVSLKKPTAYNLLDRMEQDGWIEYRGEATGDRQRKVYSVTEAGERVFFSMLREQIARFKPSEAPGLVGLSFLDALPQAEALELLRVRRRLILDYRQSLQPDDAGGEDPHSGSYELPLRYARRVAELDIEFIDEVIESIAGGSPAGDSEQGEHE